MSESLWCGTRLTITEVTSTGQRSLDQPLRRVDGGSVHIERERVESEKKR